MLDMFLLLSLVLLLGPVPAGGFVAPLDPLVVTRRFDPPAQPWLSGHRGVDLAAPGAGPSSGPSSGPGQERDAGPSAVPVRAAGAGVVVFAGMVAGRGVVSVAHTGGLRTTYEPLTVGEVRVGDPVAAGQRIGVLSPGHPGCPVAACLHWGLRRESAYLDPLALLGAGRVRLLPEAG